MANKTTNRVLTEMPVSYISTDVKWEIPRDYGLYLIKIPIENMRDDLNFTISNSLVDIDIIDIKAGGYILAITIPGTVPLGSLSISIVTPGDYDADDLQYSLANNGLDRITVVDPPAPFAVIGNDGVEKGNIFINLYEAYDDNEQQTTETTYQTALEITLDNIEAGQKYRLSWYYEISGSNVNESVHGRVIVTDPILDISIINEIFRESKDITDYIPVSGFQYFVPSQSGGHTFSIQWHGEGGMLAAIKRIRFEALKVAQ